MIALRLFSPALSLSVALVACHRVEDLRTRFHLEPLGPPAYPADNPPRQERIALGKLLFFDPILSGEKDSSCAACHLPEFAFADRRQFAAGPGGSGRGPARLLSQSKITHGVIGLYPRNTPTLFNAAYAVQDSQTGHLGPMGWDGGNRGLEEQSIKSLGLRLVMRGDAFEPPIHFAAKIVGAAAERGVQGPYLDSILMRLRSIPEYLTRFREAFPEEVPMHPGQDLIDSNRLARALGAYQRELVTRNAPYDRYARGEDGALDASQKRGLTLFHGKAGCARCHSGPRFSDYAFVVHGTPQAGKGLVTIPGDDVGREEVTRMSSDRYAFRTPGLRNVELTPPYMHDGVFGSLEEVVHFYNAGGRPRHGSIAEAKLDARLVKPLGLDTAAVGDLVAYLASLTDPGTALPAFLLSAPDRVPSGLPSLGAD